MLLLHSNSPTEKVNCELLNYRGYSSLLTRACPDEKRTIPEVVQEFKRRGENRRGGFRRGVTDEELNCDSKRRSRKVNYVINFEF